MCIRDRIAGVSLAQINSPSPKPIIKGACLLATTNEFGAPAHKTAKAYDPSRSEITFLTATSNVEPLFSRLSLLKVFNSL